MLLLRKTALMLGQLLFALSLCSSSYAADVPTLTAERPKDEACRTELKKELSSLNLTIEATDKDLSANLNRLTPKELYKGATTTAGVTAVVLRNGPITVSAADNFLYLSIPITLKLSYRMFETPAIATTLKFKLNATVSPDWKVIAQVYYLGVSDLVSESVGIGPVSLKPRSIVDGLMQPVQRTLSDLVSKKLNEQFPLKVQAAKAWNSAQKPVLLNKNYHAWLKLTPQQVLLYPFYAQNNTMRLSVGLTSYAEMVVGSEPQPPPLAPLPNLKLVTNTDRAFRIALNTDLPYKEILAIANPLLLNKELGNNGKSVILKDLDLYGNGDKLMIKVEATGSLDGTFYLSCRPVFDDKTNLFSVQDVDFDMQTKSLLLRSADWFLHGVIRSRIQEKLNMDLTQRLAQARELADKAMARVNLAEGVFLTGSVKTVKLNDVMVQKDKISIQVYAEGETAIMFH